MHARCAEALRVYSAHSGHRVSTARCRRHTSLATTVLGLSVPCVFGAALEVGAFVGSLTLQRSSRLCALSGALGSGRLALFFFSSAVVGTSGTVGPVASHVMHVSRECPVSFAADTRRGMAGVTSGGMHPSSRTAKEMVSVSSDRNPPCGSSRVARGTRRRQPQVVEEASKRWSSCLETLCWASR